MFLIASGIYYYYINRIIFTNEQEKIIVKKEKEKDNSIIKNHKILDKKIITINKYKTHIYKNLSLSSNASETTDASETIDTINILDNINNSDNSDLYYEYKGYRYLSNFPKKWINKIDKYDNIGLECLQCLHYCCITKDGQLPLFLGFCEKCYKHFIVNTSYSNDCNDCDDCESTDDCAYCEHKYGDKCITNVIDFSTEIIRTLYYYKYNNKKISNLILKLNNEYGNLNVV
jgi:hypothetical protein